METKKSKKKIIIPLCIAAAAVLAVLLVLLYRGSLKKDTGTAKKPVKQKAVTEQEVKKEDTTTSVLTGLPVSAEQRNTRPLAIMIENTNVCQPHYGLSRAGVVYECPVEGGITRLMGVFDDYSGMDRIGNVRSCRPYYVDLAAEYGAVYVHFGQSVQGQEELNKGYVDELNGLSGISSLVFYRSSDKKAPHNAYTSTDGLLKGMEKQGFETTYDPDSHTHFQFADSDSPNTLESGTPCSTVHLYFYDNKPYFTYDSTNHVYLRYQFNEPEIDAENGNTQLSVTNIILENVNDSYYDNEKYRLKLDLVGSGTGKYITMGKMIDITWKKDSETGITHYYDANGNEIRLNPGKTWISIIQNSAASRNTFE